jgi:hypothetical protein
MKKGRKMKKLSIFVVILFLCISCSNGASPKTDISTDKQSFSLTEEYPNLPLGLHKFLTEYNQGRVAIARFPKEIESVKFGNSKGEISTSKTLPQGKFWIEYLNSNDSSDVIIGKPKDGSEQIIYESKIDYSSVNCKVLYDPHNYENQTITLNLTGDLQISKAQMDINRTLIDMKRINNHSYQLDALLPDSLTAKIYVFNKYNTLFKIIDLKIAKRDERRKYFLSLFSHEWQSDICSTDDNGQDFRLEYMLNIPKPSIKDEEKYPTHPFNPDGGCYYNLISVSKDCRYFFLYSKWARPSFDIEDNVFAFEKRVQNTIFTEYLIFDSHNRTYHSIDSYCRYEFFPTDDGGPSLLEKGSVICPVKWYDDKLVCSLITKEAKQVSEGDQSYGKLNFEAGVEDAFSPYATAKGIEIDLNTFTYKDTDEFKPLSPFISFADDSTDIIGYDDIFDKKAKNRISMSWSSSFNCDFSSGTNIITDYKNSKQYVISDLFKNISPKGYTPYETIYCGSTIENEKKMLYFLFYGIDMKNEARNSRIGENEYIHYRNGYYLFFKLDFDSGSVSELFEYQKPKNKNLPVDYALDAKLNIGTGSHPPVIWTSEFSYNLTADGQYYNDLQFQRIDKETKKHLENQHYLKDGKLNAIFTGEVPHTGGFIRQVP